jgi:hypothetical protein
VLVVVLVLAAAAIGGYLLRGSYLA